MICVILARVTQPRRAKSRSVAAGRASGPELEAKEAVNKPDGL